jgi:hypothetical protein
MALWSAAVQRYLAKAFGDHLDEVRQAMDELADRHECPMAASARRSYMNA